MKKLFLILTMILGGTLFIQCDTDDDEDFVASENIQPVLLEANIPDVLTLEPQFADNTILNVSWQEADYNIPTQISYSLEVDDSEEFLEPVVLTTTSQRSTSLTVSQLNTGLSNAGIPPFQNGTAYLRIRSTIGSENVLPQFSNIINFTVFPYTTEPPRLYLVGNYQTNSGYGEENSDAPTLASSGFGVEDDYEGFVFFGGEDLSFQFHRSGFIGEYVEGNPVYGNEGGLAVEGSSGSFSVPSEGYYFVEVNLDNGEVSFLRTDWGIAGPGGPAGDWPSDSVQDADMIYDIQAKVWRFDDASTSNGQFKFRANDAWDFNFGIDGDNDGSLDFGGSDNNFENNINATTFVLDLSSARAYSFSISN